ncbi:MAG: hypothetical protein HKN82_03485, partial [Akkermansiaceae bacterium]|nr:hypothetical protein [Akkermansiaceae bacterium]
MNPLLPAMNGALRSGFPGLAVLTAAAMLVAPVLPARGQGCATCADAVRVTFHVMEDVQGPFSVTVNGCESAGVGADGDSYTQSSPQTVRLEPGREYTVTADVGSQPGDDACAHVTFDADLSCGLVFEVQDQGRWVRSNEYHVNFNGEYVWEPLGQQHQFQVRIRRPQNAPGALGATSFNARSATLPAAAGCVGAPDPPAAGDPNAQPGATEPAGVQATIPLGASSGAGSDLSAGQIVVSGNVGDLSLASRSRVSYRGLEPPGTTIIPADENLPIEQIETGRFLVILSDVPDGLHVETYPAGSYAFDAGLGRYVPDAGAVPTKSHTLLTVPADANHAGGIRLVDSSSAGTSTREIVAPVADGNCWAERTLDDQGNELSRTECYSFFSAVDDRWVRTDRTSEFRDGVLTRRIEEEWMFFEWGEDLLKSRTFTDPNNENAYLETVYAYHEDPADNGYRHVKWIIHPDGGWVKYDYTVDQVPSRIYRPWKNLPAHPDEATTANAQYEDRGYTSRVDSPYPYFETELENSAHFLPGGQLVGASWFDAWSGVGFLPTNIRSFLESRIDGDDLVTRETWQESGLTGGAPLYSVTARYNDTHPQWPGRLVARLDPDGRSEVHFHTRGDYDASTAVFTANAAGGFVQEEIFEGTGDNPEGVLLDGKPATTRRTIIRDDEGRIRRDSLAVYEGPGTFSELQVTVFDHLFDASGAVAAVTERRLDPGMPAPGRVVRETTYDTPHQTTVIDETGRATVTIRDELGRVQTVTTLGAAGDPDEVTTYARDGLVETVTRSVGPNVTTRTTIRDLAGRTVTEVDALGRVTSTTYPNGGRDTVATGPGGVAATTTRYLDGRTASVTGPGVVDTHYDYGLESGFPATTVTRGATRWEKTVADHVGREYQRITPSPDGAGTVTVTTAYALDPLGGGSTRHPARRTSTAPQVPVVLSTYDLLGRATAAGIDADADGTLTAASLDRLRTAERYFEHDGTSWWEVDVSKSYPADDSDAAQVTVRKSRLGFTDPAVLSETRVTLPTGETIATLRTVDRATATVTETRSTNLSDVDAVTVTSNGVLRSRTSHLSATPETWTYHRAGNTLETIHTDARGAVRRRIESSAGQVLTEIDPLGKHTYYLYYPADHPNAGRLRRTTNPAGETTEY